MALSWLEIQSLLTRPENQIVAHVHIHREHRHRLAKRVAQTKMDQHLFHELQRALRSCRRDQRGPCWSYRRRPSGTASGAQMKQCLAPVSRRTVMRRGPRAFARKPVKRALKAGLPRCHVWKAGIHEESIQFSYQRIYPVGGRGGCYVADHHLLVPRAPGRARHATSTAASAVSLVQQPTEPSPEPVKGTSLEAGMAAGAATRRPATTVVGVVGELPPSCAEPLKLLWLYSAKTDFHPPPHPPPPAALPCAGMRLRRPLSGVQVAPYIPPDSA